MTDGQALPMGWGFEIEDNASDKMTGIKSGLLSLFATSKKIEQETDSSPKGSGLFSFLRNLKRDKPSDEFKESNRIMGKMRETGGHVADKAKWTLRSILAWGAALAAAYLGLKGISEMIDDIWESGKKVEGVFTKISVMFRSQQEATKYRKWMHDALVSYPITEEELQAVGERFGRMRESVKGFDLRGIIAASAVEGKDFNDTFSQMADIAEGIEGSDGVNAFFKEFRDVKRTDIEKLAGHFTFLSMGATSFRERLDALSATLNKYYGSVTDELNEQLPVRLSVLSRLFEHFRETIIGEPVKGTLFYAVRKTISDLVSFFEKEEVVEKMQAVATGISVFLKSAWSAVDRWVKYGTSQLKNLLHVSDMTGAQFMDRIILPFLAWTAVAFEQARIKIKGIFVGIRDWWNTDGQEVKAGLASFWDVMKPILEYVIKHPDQLAIAIITSKVIGLVAALGAFSKVAKGGFVGGLLKFAGLYVAPAIVADAFNESAPKQEDLAEAYEIQKPKLEKFREDARAVYDKATPDEKLLISKIFVRSIVKYENPEVEGGVAYVARGGLTNVITGEETSEAALRKDISSPASADPRFDLPRLHQDTGDIEFPDFETIFKEQIVPTDKADELIEAMKAPVTGMKELVESLKGLKFPTGVTPNINVNLNVDGKKLHQVLIPYMEMKERTESKR